MALDEVGVKIISDMSEFDIQNAIDQSDRLPDEIVTYISTEVEEPDLSSITDIEDQNITITPEVTDNQEVTDLEALDDGTLEPEVAPQVDENDEVVGLLKKINAREKFEFLLDVVGNVIDFVKSVGGMVVNPFLDVEDAVAKINAQTGGTGIADLGQFVRDIQAADLGDSVDQISDVVIAAKQLNAPIEEATTATLTFTKVFDDQDPVTVMTSLKSLSDQFNISITEASDAMTVFFQTGGNKGGDALNTVNQYAQSWSDMGLSFTEALSLVQSLMAGGVDTSGDAAKMVQTFDDQLTAAAADPGSQQAKLLKMMGIDNPKDKGEAIGAETIDGFVSAFDNLPADQQDLVSGLFFGKGGKKFTSAIEGATTKGGMFADITNAASDAATEIDNSLRGAIDDFVLEVNTTLTELLSSEAIDLPGKIEAIKKGLQEAVEVLASGGTVGEALEIGLNIPGLSKTLDTFIGNFERIVGNIEIAFLQVVAVIQDLTGHGKEAEGTRATIAGLASDQLAFDLQLANPAEVGTMINQAASRGLAGGALEAPIATALNETLAKGDFAQHINILQGIIDANVAQGLDPHAGAIADEFIGKLTDQFNNASATGNLDLLQSILAIPPNAKIPGLDTAIAGFQKQLSDAFTPQDRSGQDGNPFMSGMFAGAGKQTGGNGGIFGGVTQAAADIVTDAENNLLAIQGLGTATATATTDMVNNFSDVEVQFGATADSIVTASDILKENIQSLDETTATALTENTVTASFDAVALSAEENFAIVIMWMDKTIAKINQVDATAALLGLAAAKMASLATAVAEFPFNKLQAIVAVATGFAGAQNVVNSGGNTTNNNNVNVTNINQNGAQADANTYQLGRSLGPG